MKIPDSVRLTLTSAAENIDQQIVDVLFSTDVVIDLEIGAIVLTRLNTEDMHIDRVALSRSVPATGAVNASAKPFNDIRIPANDTNNALVRVLNSQNTEVISDWREIFTPALNPQQARDNQAAAGILCSVVVPYFGKQSKGALIFSLLCSPDEVGPNHLHTMQQFSELVAEIT